jgi:hypothetical protein
MPIQHPPRHIHFTRHFLFPSPYNLPLRHKEKFPREPSSHNVFHLTKQILLSNISSNTRYIQLNNSCTINGYSKEDKL